ncbi:Uncharacterised protein [Yersinia frederiksenii]|nr:Uncharacterised protein [Yersinia frederiksenii]CNH88566.1 Uncharacterised protein [Yersinia frederiksenii]
MARVMAGNSGELYFVALKQCRNENNGAAEIAPLKMVECENLETNIIELANSMLSTY